MHSVIARFCVSSVQIRQCESPVQTDLNRTIKKAFEADTGPQKVFIHLVIHHRVVDLGGTSIEKPPKGQIPVLGLEPLIWC